MQDNESGRPAHKQRRPIQVLAPIEQVELVLSNPGFLAFCRILGLRITGGRSAAALRMLELLGAEHSIGYQVVDGWDQALRDPRLSRVLEPHELGAVFFSLFVDDVSAYDWPKLLVQALSDPPEKPA